MFQKWGILKYSMNLENNIKSSFNISAVLMFFFPRKKPPVCQSSLPFKGMYMILNPKKIMDGEAMYIIIHGHK